MKQLETGQQGLTKQVTQFLKIMEGLHGICWYRNHQSLGSRRGRPDFEVLLHNEWNDFVTIYIELKAGKGELSSYQQTERERINRAGGEYHIVRSLEELVKLFIQYGYVRVEIQNPISTKTKPSRRWWR